MKSRRRGFTLIELMVVVVIIGLLAAIALPKYSTMKAKAHFANMQTTLKNLGEAEETFFAEHGEYSSNLDSLNFTPSPEMTLTVVEATTTGWSASITHPLAQPKKCSFFLGTAAAVPPATVQGSLGCQQFSVDPDLLYREFTSRREGMIHAMNGGLWLHRHVWFGRPMAHLVSVDRDKLLRYGNAVGLPADRLQFKPLRDPRTGERRDAWHWDLVGRFLPPRP